MSFGVRWISSGCMPSFTQVSAFNLFRILPFVMACTFWQKGLMLAATAMIPTLSSDDCESWYPNGRMLRRLQEAQTKNGNRPF